MSRHKTRPRLMGGRIVGIQVFAPGGALVATVSIERLRQIDPHCPREELVRRACEAAAVVADALDDHEPGPYKHESRAQRMARLLRKTAREPGDGALLVA